MKAKNKCNQEVIYNLESECKPVSVKSVFFIKTSDIDKKTGKIKRKYGKFKREIIKLF